MCVPCVKVEGSADELAKAGLTKASLELGRDDDALLRHGGTGVHVITHPASLEPEQVGRVRAGLPWLGAGGGGVLASVGRAWGRSGWWGDG